MPLHEKRSANDGITGNIIRLLAAALLGAAPWCCAGAAPALVAPVYPGAVHDAPSGDVTFQVYLSKNPVSKVKAWYSRKGELSADDGNTLWNADGGDTKTGVPVGAREPGVDVKDAGLVVMHQSAVARKIKDMTMTRDIGVLVQSMVRTASSSPSSPAPQPPAQQGDADAMTRQLEQMNRQLQQVQNQMLSETDPADRKIAAMSDLFEGLRDELPLGHHTEKELLALYAKYRHLETAWYPTVKQPDGTRISYDRLLLKQYKDKLSAKIHGAAQAPLAAGRDLEALARRARAAAAAGRMDEMQAIGGHMQVTQEGAAPGAQHLQDVDTADRWQYWIGFLKKLDAHAYRTRIWINTKPGTWGF